jgi:CPA2 family monovalent cation:H+ antiporter-2
VFERFEPALGDGLREAALHDDEMTDHVIIAGFGRVGRAIANKLEAQGIEFVAIDSDPDRVHAGKNAGQNVYYGDAARPEVLEALRLDRARGVIVALGDPALALRLVSLLRYIFPNLKIFARAYDDEQRIALTNAGADQVVQETAGVASSLAGQVLAELRPADPEVKSPESEARQT